MEIPPQILPSRYYLAHFEEMLGFVASRYDHALADPERRFLEEFRALDEDSRCLYVRVANRKGTIFRRDTLRYPEIDGIDHAFDRLLEGKFLRTTEPGDFTGLLALEPKERLLEQLRTLPDADATLRGIASRRKSALVELAAARLDYDAVYPGPDRSAHVVQERGEEVAYLLFLYFGGVHRNLTTFALRDLGKVRTASFRSDFEARFATGEAARTAFFYKRLEDRLDAAGSGEIAGLFAESATWPTSPDAETELLRHRSLHRLGKLLEREGRSEEALAVHLRSDQFPSTERSVRLLMTLDRREEAEALLQRLIDQPSCDEELLFAEDFLERRFQRKRTGRLTGMLRAAARHGIDESARDRPEAALAGRLTREGTPAAHVENRIWMQLFGLVFWDLLFGPEHAALHDPFDFTPSDLAKGTFCERHAAAITTRLAIFDDPLRMLHRLDATWTTHRGTPNSIVPWDETLYALTRQLVAAAPRGGLALVLREIAADFRHQRSGFPDLITFDSEGVRFLEVKSEGDQLRRPQLVQLERLKKAGFRVEVARVHWTVDPGQDYVVVDLETTGGDTRGNRITEIGAVRVRGGAIIDEWTSLVNPERHIPSFVAKLTGITDAMVATAPRFAEIATDFRAFVGDAVFAAHRAKFDHGFCRAEFERIGERFSAPALCTVVEARKHFPGLKSYGLAALCQHFGIPLESHHRALCDARATAAILLRIQEARMASIRKSNPPALKSEIENRADIGF